MCGIVGYVGKKEAMPILMDGLKNLEYRGYDSAGLMILGGTKARVVKAVGKVSRLEDKIAHSGEFPGTIGIAHSRWATHGQVTETNAHPHGDCKKKIYIVHNGIIENYKELKIALVKEGHVFRSGTDTEVLAHLIEEAQKRGKKLPLEEAVRVALRKVRGTYGLVAFDTREPTKIVAARNFSPLIVGIGKDEFIVASDATAILGLTRDVLYLKDGELAVLDRKTYRIFTIKNKIIQRKVEALEWDMGTAQKDGYPHFMLKEICDEPEALRNALRGRLFPEQGSARLGGLMNVEKDLRKAKRLFISACGTAYFAGKVGECMLEEYAEMPTKVLMGSEFRYRKQIFQKDDIFLAISQSGETADTLGALREAKEKGVLTLGIVNVVGSTISRDTDAGVYEHVGPEIGVASTKSFVAQVATLALLTILLGRSRGLSFSMGRRVVSELQKIPKLMERVLKKKKDLKILAKKYRGFRNFYFLGRKYNYPIAGEGALKLKELSYVHAEGYATGELKHGPIALIDKNFVSVVIAPKDSVYEKSLSNIEEIKARGGPVIAIATEGDKKIAKIADDVIYIPKTLEMLSPLLTIVPLQLFAYYFGVQKGFDVDKPRNLAKSVTVE